MNLTEILEAHRVWCTTGGCEGTKADLTGADLAGVNLAGAQLSGAILRDANLSDAHLMGARLVGAMLTGANLTRADLTCAFLTNAFVTHADLEGANLTEATLRSAVLSGSNMERTNLTRAVLENAYLTHASLKGATLPPLAVQLPEGEFTAWKKARQRMILELVIPAHARRTASLVGRKCRAQSAHVVSAAHLDGLRPNTITFFSLRSPDFSYTLGEVVTEPNYNDDVRTECTYGIHFFSTQEEAVAYEYP